jgi:lipopolysaccharide biosynthesis glycosyltransferase
MSVLEVACTAEGDWVPHSAAMLHSLLVQHPDVGIRIHYLHGPDFSRRDERLLKQMIEANGGHISFTSVPDDLCTGLPTEGFTRKATWFGIKGIWYRILLPELLRDVDRLLCLDIDLLVKDSLRPLWEMDLRGRYVAAVTNVPSPRDAKRLAAAGFDLRNYFNSGVLLMDLELMRRDCCTEAMRRYGVTHSDQLVNPDQDALNAVLGQSRLPLHPRWNCMNSFFIFPWSNELLGPQALEEAKLDPAIRHFEGPGKPWHYLGDHDSSRLYAHHRKQTPWPRFRTEGVTPLNMLRRVKVFRRVRRRLQGKPDLNSGIASGSSVDRDSAREIGRAE